MYISDYANEIYIICYMYYKIDVLMYIMDYINVCIFGVFSHIMQNLKICIAENI